MNIINLNELEGFSRADKVEAKKNTHRVFHPVRKYSYSAWRSSAGTYDSC